MKSEKPFNALEGFDFKLLDNPEFQEDSVREVIVVPIIKALGYSENKPHQTIRSRKLLHPFVSIGSKRKDIYIIPDYVFEVNQKPAWILDAKAPGEAITKSHHVEQAYSYAIYPEVRANFFALCNGREFSLYNIQKTEPLMHFALKSLPLYWENLKKFIAPNKVFSENHFKLAKDLGLHLKRLGFSDFDSLIFSDVPIRYISQINHSTFSLSGGLDIDENNYVVTFDFGTKVLQQLFGKIPDEAIKLLLKKVDGQRQQVNFGDRVYFTDIDCKIGDALQENKEEIFLPLIINKIL